jgi:hypothetical protein
MTKTSIYVAAACFFVTGVAHAQQFQFGLRGGLTSNTPTRTYSNDESRRYLIGPVVEMRWGRLALDVSLLYQRFGHSEAVRFGSVILPDTQLYPIYHQSDSRSRAHVWQLPVVGKFYLREDSKWQPFLGTGYAFQRAWATTEGTTIFSQQGEYTTNPYKITSKASNIGVVGAAGVQFRKGRIAITPEVRYIRWGSTQDWRFQVNPNQVQATVGITF